MPIVLLPLSVFSGLKKKYNFFFPKKHKIFTKNTIKNYTKRSAKIYYKISCNFAAFFCQKCSEKHASESKNFWFFGLNSRNTLFRSVKKKFFRLRRANKFLRDILYALGKNLRANARCATFALPTPPANSEISDHKRIFTRTNHSRWPKTASEKGVTLATQDTELNSVSYW